MAQTVLVTGSNSGFGRLTVEALARQGYHVFAGMRGLEGKNAAAAQELRSLAEREALVLQSVEIDVTDDASVERAIATVVEATGRLDVVVNNAGAAFLGPIEAFTLEQVQQQFDINVFSVVRVNRAAIPYMRQQGSGLLIHVGSIVGRIALPFLGLYGATKFTLEGLIDSYRYELAPFGIDVAIVEPGTFPTPIGGKRQASADSERAALYQEAQAAFTTAFYAENLSSTPANPQAVADAISGVIAQPAGSRPTHIIVASASQTPDAQAINAAVAQSTHTFFERLNLPFATQATPSESPAVQK